MYGFCNLLLLVCCNYFIRKSRIISNLKLHLCASCFLKNLFFFRVKICIVHFFLDDVIMVDHVFTFKTDLEQCSQQGFCKRCSCVS